MIRSQDSKVIIDSSSHMFFCHNTNHILTYDSIQAKYPAPYYRNELPPYSQRNKWCSLQGAHVLVCGRRQQSPFPLLTGFHERYDSAPMEASDVERDQWFRQEEEIIDVNKLPIIPDSKCAGLPIASLDQPIEVEQATIIDLASNLITGYQLVHEPASVEFLLFYRHLDAQQLLASFWSFLNSEAGSLDQLPNVKRVSNCIQSFVHPAIHHLLGVQACHHMEVQDLVAYSNHQEYQAALVHCLDLSFAEVQNYAHQN
ncbi:hypothetical protein DSO57_1029771 [Entomophthora muscae]|uniref:Uncharacterized protein n=1 Tax=Entomophthora muscae TaxID=34485 RepID=A0ACC2S364_9FUNG|nr:hypothetical protein DSO57_1029771 [Entomophthora muscae]